MPDWIRTIPFTATSQKHKATRVLVNPIISCFSGNKRETFPLLASEQSICQARASVMVYDDTSKKWVPIKPGQQGFSRINIYHNTANNTFRVVGVKLQDQQVCENRQCLKTGESPFRFVLNGDI